MLSRVLVVGALLLLLVSLTWVHPWMRLRDPATRSARTWWVDVLQEGTRPSPWVALFVDAAGTPIDPAAVTHQYSQGPTILERGGLPRPVAEGARDPALRQGSVSLPGRGFVRYGPETPERLAAYPARPGLPTDAWGQPFVLVVDFVVIEGRQLRIRPDHEVWSSGPDGRLELGGDDISFGDLYPSSYELRGSTRRPRMPRLHVPFDTEPLWAVLALLLGAVALTAVGFGAPRSRRIGREVGLATCAAALPGLIAFFFAYDAKLERALPIADAWLLVSPRLAAALCVVLVLWGAILAWRLRRPLPPEAP